MKKTICPFLTLCMGLCACVFLGACLEVPSTPSEKGKATDVSVFVIQNSSLDSSILKINSGETAYIRAHATPTDFEDNLTFSWYYDSELIFIGKSLTIQYASTDDIPNRLVVSDKEGNTLEKNFSIFTNTPPRLGKTILPADSAIIEARQNQAITFQWFTIDMDDDSVESFLTIDDETYPVGNLTQIVQSGFKPGWHTFTITIQDSFGDKDVSEKIHFKVVDPSEED